MHVGRYAPSPTGFLHLGNASTALLAWLHTRSLGGKFILRIENIDHHRCQQIYEDSICRDLEWLGLDWDEGPYYQSERTELYQQALERLETFICSCTRKQVHDSARKNRWGEFIYPGTCRSKSSGASQGQTIRWRTPCETVKMEDLLCGTLTENVGEETGDLILRRSDGMWAYQLAVVVDDAAMGVTDVVRGADLLGNTPRQVLLQRCLGLSTPRYAHVPLLMGEDGHKLSKRHKAPDLQTLRESGVAPERIVAKIAQIHHLTSKKMLKASDLITKFSLKDVQNHAVDVPDLHSLTKL